MNDRHFPVMEIFGPTLQGEGRDIGVPCHFIRFGGCDFRCGYDASTKEWRTDGWVCDSLFAVLPERVRDEAVKLTADEIVERVRALPSNVGWVVLSGGNPLLHDLDDVVKGLHLKGFKVAVETQGTLWKPWVNIVDLVTISPKPPSSFQTQALKGLWSFLDQTHVPTIVKVVIWDEADLAYAAELVPSIGVPVYLSVCNDWQNNDTPDTLLRRLRWIQETVVEKYPLLQRATLLPQLHVLIWGNERGR